MHTRTHTDTDRHIQTHTQTQARTHTQTHPHTHIHMHMPMCVCDNYTNTRVNFSLDYRSDHAAPPPLPRWTVEPPGMCSPNTAPGVSEAKSDSPWDTGCNVASSVRFQWDNLIL